MYYAYAMSIDWDEDETSVTPVRCGTVRYGTVRYGTVRYVTLSSTENDPPQLYSFMDVFQIKVSMFELRWIVFS
jgi:hypothetical protein